MQKILYLWDLSGTLFIENWCPDISGFKSFDDYTQSVGVDKKIQPRAYEDLNEKAFRLGWIELDIAPGFKEVLGKTKNNETFSTGTVEQMDWRAECLMKKLGFDIRKFFKKFNSTFDYIENNIKTVDMLYEYLLSKADEGFAGVVYADDKLENLQSFKQAIERLKTKYASFDCHLYHILNDNSGSKDKDWYYQIGNLKDILKIEKNNH